MASTFSDNLKIEEITTGEQSGTWGITTNNNFINVFEESIVGTGNAVFITDTDLTLTYVDSVVSQVARNLYLNVTSNVALTTTRTLTVPTIFKNYVVANNTTGGQAILVKTATGTGITVEYNTTVPLYVNGTNVTYAYNPMWDPVGTAVAFAIALG
jgi:hypothetical protein